MSDKRLISLSLFAVYLAAVAYLCFAKPDNVPQLPEFWFGLPADKIGHFLMFLPFPFLGFMAFNHTQTGICRMIMLLAGILAAGTAIAASTEHIQALLQYRTADMDDLIADGIGLISGGCVTFVYIILKNRA